MPPTNGQCKTTGGSCLWEVATADATVSGAHNHQNWGYGVAVGGNDLSYIPLCVADRVDKPQFWGTLANAE